LGKLKEPRTIVRRAAVWPPLAYTITRRTYSWTQEIFNQERLANWALLNIYSNHTLSTRTERVQITRKDRAQHLQQSVLESQFVVANALHQTFGGSGSIRKLWEHQIIAFSLHSHCVWPNSIFSDFLV